MSSSRARSMGSERAALPALGETASSGGHRQPVAVGQSDPTAPLRPPERLAYTVEEAALILGVGRDLLYDEIRTGRLRSREGRRSPCHC